MKDVIIIIIITTTGNGMVLIISRNQPGSTGVLTSRFAKLITNHIQSTIVTREIPGHFL